MQSILMSIAGPGLVFVLRYLAPTFLKKMPTVVQPLLAGAIGVVLSLATGDDPTLSITTLVEAINAFVMTGGIVKLLDMLKNRSNTVKPVVKKALKTPEVKLAMEAVLEKDEFEGLY